MLPWPDADMSDHPRTSTPHANPRRPLLILALAAGSASAYLYLALAGDLRDRLPVYWAVHAVLFPTMLLAWCRIRKRPSALRLALGAALLFRLVAAIGEPALSDDIYRYVWDGRVQWHGVHPYLHAPDDPALAGLRDENWSRINHRELKTIYPPLAQVFFAVLAGLGAGPLGFKLAIALIDFGVVLALLRLLRLLGANGSLVMLYAWNPLPIIEGAGSGHIEPLGVLLVLLAAAWMLDRRPGWSMGALAAAIQTKLLPVVLLPALLRRLRAREVLLLGSAVVALWLPYAITGPPVGAGLFDYAGRWERNSAVFSMVHGATRALDTGNALKPWVARMHEASGASWVPWDFLYRHVWPDGMARLVVGMTAACWLGWLAFRFRGDAPREMFLALAGVLLLAPTLHPWYVLWVLPFACAYRCWPWLLLAALVPLAYAGAPGDVPWLVRIVEYGPPLVVAVAVWLGRHRSVEPGSRPGVPA